MVSFPWGMQDMTCLKPFLCSPVFWNAAVLGARAPRRVYALEMALLPRPNARAKEARARDSLSSFCTLPAAVRLIINPFVGELVHPNVGSHFAKAFYFTKKLLGALTKELCAA